jgi:phosphotransferase system enzyme I (PtsI)
MQDLIHELIICGSPICRGIAIGKPFFLKRDEIPIKEINLSKQQTNCEIERYRIALKRSQHDIKALQEQLNLELASEGVSILESQLAMLIDPILTIDIEQSIHHQNKNAEFILQQTVVKLKNKFNMIEPYFAERYKDLHDLSKRIINNLFEFKDSSINQFPPYSIVCSKELSATDIASANASLIAAFITESGGSTSHAAIIAKAKGIPFITNIDLNLLKDNEENLIILDGRQGKIILNPSSATLENYERLKVRMQDQIHDYQKTINLPAETYDGYSVRLFANLEMPNELDLIHQMGGQGIGLFRSEYIFFPKSEIPSEEKQYQIYANLFKQMNGLPIVVRTFDLGGDKAALSINTSIEKTPFLGCRATRFLLKNEKLFKSQLRAILRASVFGDVSILFPMISTISELKEAKRMVYEVRQELNINHPIRLGCMIEVPSAALIADHFAKECDFLSIGTNDLVQYSLAVDRRDNLLNEFYEPTDPSVIRLMRIITQEANKACIPVSVCGEIASDPRFTPLLLGLGIQELSVAPRYLPLIKNAIRNTSIVDAINLAEKALTLLTAQEIMALLIEEYQKTVPSDLFYNDDFSSVW